MDGNHSDAALSTPVTIARKGVVFPPQDQLDEARFKDSIIAGVPAGRTVSETKRLSVVASRSLSSGSSSSESNSVLSTESSSSSMAATDATSQDDVSEDEKSSGHTVVRTDSKVDSGALQLAGEQDAPTGHVGPSSPALTRTSSQDSGAAELPVSAPQQHLANRQQGRTRPTRHNTHTAGVASASVALLERDQSSRSRPVPGGGHAEHARSHSSHSTSPRHTLSRSYTTSAVSSMGAPAHLLTNNSSTSSNLPQPFPGTSSIAPPVQNSASVTFAPPPTRTRAYSTSASGLASPTSPALESMASLNLEAMRLSPPGSSSASSSGSPPTAPLASSHALMGATSSPPPASTANWKSSSGGYDGRGEAFPAAASSSSGSAMPLSSPHPSFNSSAANRRHSVDPYSQRNNNITNNNNIINLNNTTPPPGAFGHRRHHQSISVPPSSSEYSSLGDHQVQNHQASHLHHLSSRYRKSSLGSQALLSPKALDHMTSPTSSLHTSSQGGSSGRAQQWDHHAHRSHHALGDPGGGPQLSPTRSRNDQYLSTSPRYSSRASHEAQPNNQLEAKIVLLGRQGVGKTSLVHRYITGKFSSSLPMTIGASFLVKKLDFEGGIKVRLQIWDTAGQERFRSMAPMYYRGAHAAILVYDITNDDSLADIQVWLDELRQNMSSDLIVHIVGNKADLAHSSRKITLEDAKRQISEWIARPASGIEASSLNAPQARRSTSGGHTSRVAEESSPAPARTGMVGLGSFNLTRSGVKQKGAGEEEPALPAFKDWGLEEVSAKEDDGIDMLFATIAGKLVERKSQIEQERVLRTKDSIMITDEMKGKTEDPTRVWGCC